MTMTLSQILALVGNLDDSAGEGTSRERFRRFLKENAKDVGQLRDYIQECLQTPGAQYNRALQDLVNCIGSFLGFEVVFGRYQGVQGQVGFDGHWKSPKGFHIVIEIKTTDAYAIKTATLTGYVDGLISEKKIPSWDDALGLYAVGRPDADLKQLENAIVAEKRTHQLRVISIESLVSLGELMANYDISHEDVLSILRPSGPRIDPVVELISGLVADTEILQVSEPAPAKADEKALTIEAGGSGSAAFWLTPVQSDEEETAEECIQRLVGEEHFYNFSKNAPGRRHMRAGDWICFYATTKGVVAHAMLSTAPEKKPCPNGKFYEDYPWVILLKDARLYLENPIAIDANLRRKLDAFRGRDEGKGWAWFVQATNKVTSHDFELLTHPTTE